MYTQAISKKCQRGELNSRPTPKAFGAALPLQVIDCELRVLFPFQGTFYFSGFGKRCDFFLGHNLKLVSESFRGRCVTAEMLRGTCLKIDSRTDVMATG